MHGKFVWAEGHVEISRGANDYVHHFHLMQKLVDEKGIPNPPENYMAGWWTHKYDPDRMDGWIEWQDGRTPELEEVLNQVQDILEKDQAVYTAKDYAATMERLAQDYEVEDDGAYIRVGDTSCLYSIVPVGESFWNEESLAYMKSRGAEMVGPMFWPDNGKNYLQVENLSSFGRTDVGAFVTLMRHIQSKGLPVYSMIGNPKFIPIAKRFVVAATSEDTEPVGKNVGFLAEPHDELYPCLFQGEDDIPAEVIEKLKNHVVEPLSEVFDDPDYWIAFSIYGSGISYNWDEGGDMDIQMWVDINKYHERGDEDYTVDDLVSEVRKIVQTVNFPSFKDLGLTYEECEGNMLIQYYPKPGTGSKEENLASKPYACYDLDQGIWLEPAKPIRPKFYGETFLRLMPKAEEIAIQAENLLADYKRDLLNWEFWEALYRRYKKDEFKEERDRTVKDAEQRLEGIENMFSSIFGDRAKAYSPEGKGILDERDIMQKLLEVWGTFQDLKHWAREPFPWEKEMPVLSQWEIDSRVGVNYCNFGDGKKVEHWARIDDPKRGRIIMGMCDFHYNLWKDTGVYWRTSAWPRRRKLPQIPTPEGWTKAKPEMFERNMELIRLKESPNPQESINAQVEWWQNIYGNASYQFDSFVDSLMRNYNIDYTNAEAMVTRAFEEIGLTPELNPYLAAGADMDGAMIAFFIPEDVANHIKIEGGEEIKNMHITLAYFADKASERDDWDEVQEILKEYAATMKPLSGKITGYGTFNTDDGKVLWAQPEIDGIEKVQKEIVKRVEEAGFEINKEHDFKPHITLKYEVEEIPEWEEDIDVTFNEISFAQGEAQNHIKISSWKKALYLPGFRILSADIRDLASKAWGKIYEQQYVPFSDKVKKQYGVEENGYIASPEFRSASGRLIDLASYIIQSAPETYKLYPILFRDWKHATEAWLSGRQDSIPDSFWTYVGSRSHVRDILLQATEVLEKMRDNPNPEVQVPDVGRDFKPNDELSGFTQLENWLMEIRRQYIGTDEPSPEANKPVHTFENDWTIQELASDNLGWEGEQMGHCVGGYCRSVDAGNSRIFSLRDEVGFPHATIEFQPRWNTYREEMKEYPLILIQAQGKGNAAPKEEYKAMIKEWIQAWQASGQELYGNELEIYGIQDLISWHEYGVSEDEYGIPSNIEVDPDNLLNSIAEGFSESGDRDRWNYGYHFDYQETREALFKIIEQFPTYFWGKFAQDEIEKLYIYIDEVREQNYDWLWEGVYHTWKYDHPDEEVPEEWWDHPDLQAVYEEGEEELAKPWQQSLELMREIVDKYPPDAAPKTTSRIVLAEWVDVVDKATRYYNEGRVQMLNNTPDHAIATVNGDTGTYETEIWKQDPNKPNVLSGWACSCPWGQHSWGRTRIWQQYEGRSCAHVLCLTWEAQRQPFMEDAEGNQQQQLFDPNQMPGRSFEQYMAETPTTRQPSQLKTVQDIGQLELPGTFSSWKRVAEQEPTDEELRGIEQPHIPEHLRQPEWMRAGDFGPHLYLNAPDGIHDKYRWSYYPGMGINVWALPLAEEYDPVTGQWVADIPQYYHAQWESVNGIQDGDYAGGIIELENNAIVEYHALLDEDLAIEGLNAAAKWSGLPKPQLSRWLPKDFRAGGWRIATQIVETPDDLMIHNFDSRENPWRRTYIYDGASDILYLAPNNVFHNEIFTWIQSQGGEWDPYNYSAGFVQGDELYEYHHEGEGLSNTVIKSLENFLGHPLIEQSFDPPRPWWEDRHDDYEEHPNDFGEVPWWSWERVSAFMNGDFVRAKVKLFGTDDRGQTYAVPKNTTGEVLYSDDESSVVIFNLASGPLGAHLIKVEDSTEKFNPAPSNIRNRGPAPRRRV